MGKEDILKYISKLIRDDQNYRANKKESECQNQMVGDPSPIELEDDMNTSTTRIDTSSTLPWIQKTLKGSKSIGDKSHSMNGMPAEHKRQHSADKVRRNKKKKR